MIRWTIKDCIRCLNELKDPFEGETEKPTKFSQVLNALKGKGGIK